MSDGFASTHPAEVSAYVGKHIFYRDENRSLYKRPKDRAPTNDKITARHRHL
jgi:hypothetical protein